MTDAGAKAATAEVVSAVKEMVEDDLARDAQGFDAETHAEPNTPQAKGPRPTPPRLGLRQKVKAARRENRRRRQQAKRTPRKGRQ